MDFAVNGLHICEDSLECRSTGIVAASLKVLPREVSISLVCFETLPSFWSRFLSNDNFAINSAPWELLTGNDADIFAKICRLLNPSKKNLLVIDSFSPLIKCNNLSNTLQLILRLLNCGLIETVVGILHKDTVSDVNQANIRDLAAGWYSFSRQENNALLSRTVNKFGKIFSRTEMIELLPNFEVKFTPLTTKSNKLMPTSQMEPTSSFNLSLNKKERENKAKLVLPYIEAQQTRKTQGNIEYELEAQDLEDPDADLDV